MTADAYINLTPAPGMPPVCPHCRGDLMTIDALTLSGELIETLYFCPGCGFEDVITAADDGWQGDDEDTQPIEVVTREDAQS